jgi:hypothetical protein
MLDLGGLFSSMIDYVAFHPIIIFRSAEDKTVGFNLAVTAMMHDVGSTIGPPERGGRRRFRVVLRAMPSH